MNRPLVGLSVYFRHTMKHGDQIAPHFGKKNWKMQKSFSFFFGKFAQIPKNQCVWKTSNSCHFEYVNFLVFWRFLTILLQYSVKKNYLKNSRNQQLYMTRSEDFRFSHFDILKELLFFDHYFWFHFYIKSNSLLD